MPPLGAADVSPGSLSDDLFRRDFTINAIAVALNAGQFGELIDLYGGLPDLEHKLCASCTITALS